MRSFDQSRAFSTMGNEWRFNLQSSSSSIFDFASLPAHEERVCHRLQKSRTRTSSRTRTIWLWLRRTMIRTTSARIAAQFLNVILFAVASPAQDAQNPPAAVSRGKQIYLYGTGYNGV